MGLKAVFRDGMAEWRRRRALGREKRSLQEKEGTRARRLAALGGKAWEAKIDITAHGDSPEKLAALQHQLDWLRERHAELQQKRREMEEKRKQANEQFTAAWKEIDTARQGVDKNLRQQMELRKTRLQEKEQAVARLARIPGERQQVQARLAAANLPEAEKGSLAAKLASLAGEEAQLQERLPGLAAAAARQEEVVAPLQAESERLQKQAEGIRAEQRRELGRFDQALAALRKESEECLGKQKEAGTAQQEAFRLLGERLFASGAVDPAVAPEMAAAREAEAGVTAVQAQMQALDGSRSDAGSKAFRLMAAMAAGIVILILVLVALLLVRPGRRKPAGPADFLGGGGGGTQEQLAQAVQRMVGAAGGLKQASEQQQGGEIVLADESRLSAALPQVSGWRRESPVYSRGAAGDIETAHLSAAYDTADGRRVEVEVTDTGTASALLAPLKSLFALNLEVDNDTEAQRVTTRNGVPVVERLDKQSGQSTFGFILHDRFLVELRTGDEEGLELLRRFVAGMDLAGLRK